MPNEFKVAGVTYRTNPDGSIEVKDLNAGVTYRTNPDGSIEVKDLNGQKKRRHVWPPAAA